ncbi:MAG: prolipoprotein diacylglyceryl transferase [Propionibacteriaceae bacterium]|nr:prolipoprotein diacylglyceryl transferase [Propionibacteriaceae bacterium]
MLLELPFPNIDPVAIRLGPLAIHWYAISYLVAFALGYALMRYRLRLEPYRSITAPARWTKTDVEDMLMFAMLGVILGGRLGYALFYQPGAYLADPTKLLRLWEGGMSFHGGLVGVILGLAWFAWRRKRPFLQVSDLLVVAAPIGLAMGRIGNFINGELWGREASAAVPWAMRFPTGGDVLRHPSQIYQALLEGLLLFLLLWWYAAKPRYRGQVSGAFLVGYGVLRFLVEFYREPDAFLGLLGLGLSMGQWLCVPMILCGAGLWWWSRRRAILDAETPDEEDADAPAVLDPGPRDTEEPAGTGHETAGNAPAKEA